MSRRRFRATWSDGSVETISRSRRIKSSHAGGGFRAVPTSISSYRPQSSKKRATAIHPSQLRDSGLLAGLPLLEITPAAHDLKAMLLEEGSLPQNAEADALHIATATVHGIEYLLTWNCKHIANAVTLPSIYAVCRDAGYDPHSSVRRRN